jgi:hypothetical protein
VSHYFDAASLGRGLDLQAEIARQMLDKVDAPDPAVVGDLWEHSLSRICVTLTSHATRAAVADRG